MIESVKKIVAPLQRRIMLMISRAVIKQINDEAKFQMVQISALKGETLSNIERFQDYGLTSHPPQNSEAICCFLGGNRDHGIAIKVDNRDFRLKGLKKGEVALYTDEGDKIHLKRGNKIEIITKEAFIESDKIEIKTKEFVCSASNKAEITAPIIALNGNLTASGGGGATTIKQDKSGLSMESSSPIKIKGSKIELN